MLTLLLGSDWIANRNEVFRLIAQDVSDKKNGIVLMVPELISHDTERRLCVTAGDTASRFAEVLSFTRLARRVADADAHAAVQCLDNGGRMVAMASAVQQLHGRLKAYAALETKPEFLAGLVDTIDEFKRCCITTNDLADASARAEGSLAQRLEELAMILETYDAICLNGKKDPRDQMTWLLEELEDSTFAQSHTFYVDGFPDFTRQHMAILEHLIRCSGSITISLNCDKPGSTELEFEKAGSTALELLGIARRFGVEVKIITVPSRTCKLGFLHKNLFQGPIPEKIPAEQLCLYNVDTIYQECLCVAQKVMDLIRAGSRYRDIAVVCADMAAYKNTLSMVFERCHIPVYISGTDEVLGKPVISSVLSALSVVLNAFDQQSVFDYLRTTLSPLDFDACDRVENYAIMWGISGSRWLETWTMHPDGLNGKWDEDSRDQLDSLNNFRELLINPLKQLREDLQKSANLAQQVEALYGYFEDIQLDRRLSELAEELDNQGNNRDSQILNQLWDILITALEQLHDVLGNTVWETDAFARLFRLLLSQYDVGTIPSVLDSVSIGPVNAMRCHQSKHLFVLGAVEGCLPKYGGASGVLSDQERTALRDLGVNLTGGAADGLQIEFSEIYGVFCGADDSATISYAGGQPSFLYRRLCHYAQEQHPSDWELGGAMGDPLEAGAYFARYQEADAAEALGLSEQYQYFHERKNYGVGAVEPENVYKLYGDKLMLSASQIDRQAECRLSYFLKYGLRANERRPAAVDPAEFGTYVHAVLEETAREIKEKGGFKAVSLETACQIAKGKSEAYAAERFGDIDSQRAAYLFNRNSSELDLIVQELWKELHDSRFAPVGFEVGFGVSEERAAIQIPSNSLMAQLRGFIDRVDCWQDGENNYFRVVDYKTGKKNFDYCDVFNGIGLQMLLYLFALEQAGNGLLDADAKPAGVQYFPARVPLISADGSMTEQEAEASREKLWKRNGLLLSDASVLDAMDSESAPNRLPISRKKDGSISGDIANATQFEMLREYVFSCVGKMVDEIASGKITPNPYTRGTSHDACSFCPYGVVCHPNTVAERRNYKQMSAERFWEEIRKEVVLHE